MDIRETLSGSLEDYLKAILRISNDRPAVRVKEIAAMLAVGKSSVTGALRLLAERQLVNYAPYDLITLTDRGREVAEQCARRHAQLQEFLMTVLTLDAAEADKLACSMEHIVPEAVVDRFVKYSAYVQSTPAAAAEWVPELAVYREPSAAKSRLPKPAPKAADLAVPADNQISML